MTMEAAAKVAVLEILLTRLLAEVALTRRGGELAVHRLTDELEKVKSAIPLMEVTGVERGEMIALMNGFATRIIDNALALLPESQHEAAAARITVQSLTSEGTEP